MGKLQGVEERHLGDVTLKTSVKEVNRRVMLTLIRDPG